MGAPDDDLHDRVLQVGSTQVYEVDAATKPAWSRVTVSGKEIGIVEPGLVGLLEHHHKLRQNVRQSMDGHRPTKCVTPDPMQPDSSEEEDGDRAGTEDEEHSDHEASDSDAEPKPVSKGLPMYQHLRTQTNHPRYRLHIPEGEEPWVQVVGATIQQQRVVRSIIPNPAPKAFRYLGVHLQTDLGWASQEQVLLEAVHPVLDRIKMLALSRAQVRTLVESNVMSKLTYVLTVASVSDEFIDALDKRIESVVKGALRIRRSYANALVHDPHHGAGVGRLRDAVDRAIIKAWAVHLETEDESFTGAVAVMRARQVAERLGVGVEALARLTRWRPKDEQATCSGDAAADEASRPIQKFTRPEEKELDRPLWERSWVTGRGLRIGSITCDESGVKRTVKECPAELTQKLATYQKYRTDLVKYSTQAGGYSRLRTPRKAMATLPKALRKLVAPEGTFEIDLDCCVFQALAQEYSKWARDHPPPNIQALIKDKVAFRLQVSAEARAMTNSNASSASSRVSVVHGKECLRDAAGRLSPLCTGARRCWHAPKSKRLLMAEVYNVVLGLVMKDYFGCMIKIKENAFQGLARVYQFAVENLGAQENPELFASIKAMSVEPYAGTTPFEEHDELWNCPLEYILPEDALPDLTAVARIVLETDQAAIPHVYQPPGSPAPSCTKVAWRFHEWFAEWVPDRNKLSGTNQVGICASMTAARRKRADEEHNTMSVLALRPAGGRARQKVRKPAAAAGLAYFTSGHEARMLNICLQRATELDFRVVAYVNDALLLTPGPNRVTPEWLCQVAKISLRNHGYWGGVTVELLNQGKAGSQRDPDTKSHGPARRKEPREQTAAPPNDSARAGGGRLGLLRRTTIPRATNTRFESFVRALGRTGMKLDWKEGYCPLVEPRSSRPNLTTGRPWVMWAQAIPNACKSWRHLDEIIDGRRLRSRAALQVWHDPRDCVPPSDPVSRAERALIAARGKQKPLTKWSQYVQQHGMRRSPALCEAVSKGLTPGGAEWRSPGYKAMTVAEYAALKSVVCCSKGGLDGQQGDDQPEVDRDLWGMADNGLRRTKADGHVNDIRVGDVVAMYPQMHDLHTDQPSAFTWHGVVRAIKTASEGWSMWTTGTGAELLTTSSTEGYMEDTNGHQLVFVEQLVPCDAPTADQKQDRAEMLAEQRAAKSPATQRRSKRSRQVGQQQGMADLGGQSSELDDSDDEVDVDTPESEGGVNNEHEGGAEQWESDRMFQPWPFLSSPVPGDVPMPVGSDNDRVGQYTVRRMREYRVGHGVGTTVKNRWEVVPASELYPVIGGVAMQGGITNYDVYGGSLENLREADVIDDLPPPSGGGRGHRGQRRAEVRTHGTH